MALKYCKQTHIKSIQALMEQEKKKNELLKLYVWDEKKKRPMETAKALEASLERR